VHARQILRDQILAAVTGLTTTGARAHASRIYPLEQAGLPALRLWTREERVIDDSRDLGSARALRELTLRVEAVARLSDTLDDQLDDIAAEVEAAIVAAYAGGGIGARSCDLVSTSVELLSDAEEPTGVAALDWRVIYFTDGAAPTALG